MKFYEKLQAHRGELFIMRSEIYWYSGPGSWQTGGWDGAEDRLFILMDARAAWALGHSDGVARRAEEVVRPSRARITALIDGRVHTIHVAPNDVELAR